MNARTTCALITCCTTICFAIAGCYAHSRHLANSEYVGAVSQAYHTNSRGQPPTIPDCELWMQLSHSRTGAGPVRRNYEIISEDTCIKRKGQAIAFPGTIVLVYDPRNGAGDGAFGYCDEDPRAVVMKAETVPGVMSSAAAGASEVTDLIVSLKTSDKAKAEVEKVIGADGRASNLKACAWNRLFRDAYPLSFRIHTTPPLDKSDASAKGLSRPVSTYVQMAQIFRNGELIYRWQAAEIDATEIYIDGKRLETDGMPNEADFDLRLYPAGATIDEAVLKQKVRERGDLWARRFETVGRALANAPVFSGGTSLKTNMQCFLWTVDNVRKHAAKLSGDTSSTPIPGTPSASPANCPSLKDVKNDSLLERYRKLKQKTKDEVDAEVAAIGKELEEALGQNADAIKKALESAKAELVAFYNGPPPTTEPEKRYYDELHKAYARGQELVYDLKQLDELADATLQAVDDTRALATRLRDDVVTIAQDPEKQVALYHAVTESLKDKPDPFDPYQDNPPLVDSAIALDMKYSDRFQWYFMAIWSGVAFRPTEGFKTTPSVGYLIPILDVLGARYQGNRSRWADLRLGLGFIAVDDRKSTQPNSSNDSVMRAGAQTSLALGPIRAGIGYVFNAATGGDQSKWRVLIGADLYKLIAGRNLEVAGNNF